jgi:hypothetical protein
VAYYLDKKEIVEAFHEDESEAFKFFEKYDEIERLTNNKPKDKLPEGMTGVTDGDLASALRKIPKEYMSQVFSGKVSLVDARDYEDWVAEAAQLRWEKRIVPNANYDDYFFNKQLDWGFRASKYGSQPMFAFLRVTEDYAGADCALPYIRNVIIEKGKVSDLGSNRIYLVQSYDKYTLKRIVAAAEAEERKAKAEKRKSHNTWVIPKLKELIDNGSEEKKDQRQQNYTERQNNVVQSGYRIVHCFQRGSEAPFYSFAPSLPENENIVKVDQNSNPTGDMPLMFMYTDIERENPYGLGLAELAGSNQNIQDAMTQLSVFNGFQLGNPAMDFKGNRNDPSFDANSIKNIPGKLRFIGQNNDISPAKNSASSFFSQFPNMMGFYKAQQQKMLGSRDGSVSSEAGDPNFSKTSAGVKENVRSNNVDGNFLTKRHAQAYSRLASTMLNIDFANMENEDVIEITEEEAVKLDRAGMEMDRDGDGNITSRDLLIEFNRMRAKYRFEVDENSSKEKTDADDAEELVSNIETIGALAKLPPKIQFGDYLFDTGEYANVILHKQGLPDIEKFMTKMELESLAAGNVPPEATGQAEEQQMPPQPQVDLQAIHSRAAQLSQTHGIAPQLAVQLAQMEAEGIEPDKIMEFVSQQGALDARR